MTRSSGLFSFVLAVFSCCATAGNSLAVDAFSPVAADIPYRAALFHQQMGEHEQGLLVLSLASPDPAAQVNSYRNMLEGHLNIALKRYAEAERSLAPLNDPQLFPEYNAQVLYPLIQAYYAQGRCDKAIDALNRAQGFPAEINAHVMYMRVGCLLARSSDATVISQAEGAINDALVTQPAAADNMWFAYAYFNVASTAAGKFQYYNDADRLFNRALAYVDDSAEGKALRERTLLNLGLANYADNRFDYAAQAFSQLPVNGIWADISLLAYGWSAVSSYKPDMAIEAWRQLVSLPYKSMSVYEGYMAIPAAFEKSNSYSEALDAYDAAIAEFIKVTSEIDQLKSVLSRQKIHEYAIEYAKNDQEGAVPSLPSLLARTYTEDKLRGLVEMINEVELYRKRLAAYEETLQVLEAKNAKANPLKDDAVSLRQQSEQLLTSVETQLLEQTHAVLDQQKQKILQYTLAARVANARLQEEFFQRGGRRLWR